MHVRAWAAAPPPLHAMHGMPFPISGDCGLPARLRTRTAGMNKGRHLLHMSRPLQPGSYTTSTQTAAAGL